MALSASAWASIPEIYIVIVIVQQIILLKLCRLIPLTVTFFLDMEFDYYTDTYVYDSNPKNLGVLDCLNYLKDKLVFTSDSKQEVPDAFTRTVERVMDSPIVQAGIKKRLKKISDNISDTFERKDIVEFFCGTGQGV
ncbi:hypothetical protein RhiirA4_508688 [Rhizophagus irregularis]|uniref:Uncharacterized protein n=1 Tax=Rhizophagus irregularis TaxID=588596 RepID=A0A2I1G932_9GLOM|nr:hypothetical protein RhiirA4_508688 [Rhizophagus irregularis]